MGRKAITEKKKREIEKYIKMGIQKTKISILLGISRQTIYKYINRENNNKNKA